MFRDIGKKLVFVRHGQSVYNVERRFYGWEDCDLTDLGREQAEIVAAKIKNYIEPDIIISSDLKRAYNTAKPIADVYGMDVVKYKDLRELYVGDWEGKKIEDLKSSEPENFERFIIEQKKFHFPNGESYYELYQRARKQLDEVLEEHSSVIMVAHYGVIDTLLSGLFFKDPTSLNSFVAKNSSIIYFELIGEQAILHNFNV